MLLAIKLNVERKKKYFDLLFFLFWLRKSRLFKTYPYFYQMNFRLRYKRAVRRVHHTLYKNVMYINLLLNELKHTGRSNATQWLKPVEALNLLIVSENANKIMQVLNNHNLSNICIVIVILQLLEIIYRLRGGKGKYTYLVIVPSISEMMTLSSQFHR